MNINLAETSSFIRTLISGVDKKASIMTGDFTDGNFDLINYQSFHFFNEQVNRGIAGDFIGLERVFFYESKNDVWDSSEFIFVDRNEGMVALVELTRDEYSGITNDANYDVTIFKSIDLEGLLKTLTSRSKKAAEENLRSSLFDLFFDLDESSCDIESVITDLIEGLASRGVPAADSFCRAADNHRSKRLESGSSPTCSSM